MCSGLRAAAYLSAPCATQNGVQLAPDSYEEFLTQYYSGGWDTLCQTWNYDGPARDEPLFILFDIVNEEDFSISSTEVTFVSQYSLPVFECISAWAMSRSAPSARRAVNGAPAPQVAPQTKARGSEARSFKIPATMTDTAWKAIWQEVVRRSTDSKASMPTEAEVTTVLTEFVKQLGQNRFQIGAAKAPFIRTFQLDDYNDMSFTDPITAFLKKYGVGPGAPEEEGSAGKKRARPRASSGGRPTRRLENFGEGEEGVDDLEGVGDLEGSLSAAIEQGALVQKLEGKVRAAEQTGRRHNDRIAELESVKTSERIAELESFKTSQDRWAKQVDSRLAQASGTPSAEQANLKEHLTQMSAIMGNLASIMGTMNVVLGSAMFGSQSAIAGPDGGAKSFVDQLTKPSFDGIINSIDNVYRWNKEQKMAFYASVQSIQVFKTKLDDLQKDEMGSSSAQPPPGRCSAN